MYFEKIQLNGRCYVMFCFGKILSFQQLINYMLYVSWLRVGVDVTISHFFGHTCDIRRHNVSSRQFAFPKRDFSWHSAKRETVDPNNSWTTTPDVLPSFLVCVYPYYIWQMFYYIWRIFRSQFWVSISGYRDINLGISWLSLLN